MKNPQNILDSRSFRPTAILVIDLVKHSTRSKADIHVIQNLLQDVFQLAIKRLDIKPAYFTYTGDGYVCALVGSASARLPDFVNATFPDLCRLLSEKNQEFRAGVDFGLLHLAENPLTKTLEHFDLPGIQAARLEACAKSGQILCTTTVHSIFSHHYPHMFSSDSIALEAKDRIIDAYEVFTMDFGEIHTFFSNYMFRRRSGIKKDENRRKIMFVDDDHHHFAVPFFKENFPNFEIVAAYDGLEALELFTPGEFAAVTTDQLMPRMCGVDLTRALVNRDKDLPVIMLTVHNQEELAREFFSAGGFYFLDKLVGFPSRITDVMNFAIENFPSASIRQKLDIIWVRLF